MKTTNRSNARKNRWRTTINPPGARIEGGLYVLLGIIGLCSIALAALVSARPLAESTQTGGKQLPIVRYIRSGQLKADIRTLASIASYLLQPEGDSTPATVQQPVAKTNVALTTAGQGAVIRIEEPGDSVRIPPHG